MEVSFLVDFEELINILFVLDAKALQSLDPTFPKINSIMYESIDQ